MNLTKVIKDYSQRLGFSLVGVTTPDPLPHAQVFENWLQQGRHGEMTYLSSERSRGSRAYPRALMPEVRSVLVLGMRYPAPAQLASQAITYTFLYGNIAAYAWGDDYHTVLPERLKELVDFIGTQAGHSITNRWYTDTGPLLERELAQRAGLGWIGKNTCLINPSQGSYFLLAEILLGIELEPDHPFMADRCGTCQRCIDACPTSCILPDRTLDARRCISYLTIELRGVIPSDLRPLMGTHIFGCDVCQQVCPWNRFATGGVDQTFTSWLTQPTVDLLEEMAQPRDEFNARHHCSPLKRTKRKGYLRNIAVALGNLHNQDAIAILAKAINEEPEPLIRLHFAWALGQIGGAHALKVLKNAFEVEPDPQIRQEICNILECG